MGQDLLAKVAQRDSKAFREIYDIYSTPVYNYLLRLIHQSSVAEELLQDVFLAVWEGSGRFQGRSSVKTWIFRIAHNQAVSWIRKGKKQDDHLLEDDEALDLVPASLNTPEDYFFSNWRADQIISALKHLSETHRAVIELAFVHDLSYTEIAEVMSCPLGTVKSRINYALLHLKRILIGLDVDAGISNIE